MICLNPYVPIKFIAISILVLTMLVSPALAQHSDVEFSYQNGKIEVEFGPEGPVFESEMPTTGALKGFANLPGFASEAAEGLGINPGNLIRYNVVGPLRYHDGNNFAVTSVTISGDDQPNSGTVVISSSTAAGDGLGGLIGQADGIGDFHTDLGWLLSDPSPVGAYGALLDLETDEPGIADSDPFFIVFNFGLDEQVFESTVEAFAAIVPEPASFAVVGLGTLFLLVRRRLVRT